MQNQYNSYLLNQDVVKEELLSTYETARRYVEILGLDRNKIQNLLKQGSKFEKEVADRLNEYLLIIIADSIVLLEFLNELAKCSNAKDIEQLLTINRGK